MATFLICHGAWSAGWAWKKVRPLLRAVGHEVFTPTCNRSRRARASGQPVRRSGDAHQGRAGRHRVRGPERFYPGGAQLRRHGRDGGGRSSSRAREAADLSRRLRAGEWAEPARPQRPGAASGCHGGPRRGLAGRSAQPTPPDTSAADLAWITPRRRPQPVKTFTQPWQLRNPGSKLARSYIYCTKKTPDDVFLHSSPSVSSPIRNGAISRSTPATAPTVTAPEALVRLLDQIAPLTTRD